MKKPKKRPARVSHKRKRKGTPNPLFIPAGTVLGVDVVDGLDDIAADLLVAAAIANCTTVEKMMIAALIPEFLKITRPKVTAGTEDREPCRCGHPRASHHEHAVWCGWPNCKCRAFEAPEAP